MFFRSIFFCTSLFEEPCFSTVPCLQALKHTGISTEHKTRPHFIFFFISSPPNLFLILPPIPPFVSQIDRGWDKSPSLSIIFGLSSKTQWLSGLYYADFISFYSPTQLCGGGTTKSNSNELPISVPLSLKIESRFYLRNKAKVRDKIGLHSSDRFGS